MGRETEEGAARVAAAPGRSRAAGVRRPAYALLFAGVGLLAVVLTSLVASNGRVGRAERAVFEAINGLPDAVRWPMWFFQLMGLVGLPAVVALVALVLRRWRLAIGLIALAPLKLYVEKPILKGLVHRERPGRTEPEAILRDVPAAGASFPSGHAVIAFGVAMLLTPYLSGRWRLVVWTLAVLNSVARVYLGAHNPLDVVCGAGAGVVMGGVLTWILGVPGPRRRAQPAPAESAGRSDRGE
jgi:membrane-associated phospholipid phosphatase